MLSGVAGAAAVEAQVAAAEVAVAVAVAVRVAEMARCADASRRICCALP